MTEDVRFQKGFLWIGRRGREGKGTIAGVLERLCDCRGARTAVWWNWVCLA
jgi:hypothetical protein